MKYILLLLSTLIVLNANAQAPEIVTYAQLEARINSQQPGEIVVYNFWATWCKPCVEEMPYFEQLNKEYAKKGVRVVFVSLDFSSKKQKVADFVTENEIQAEVIMLVDPDANAWINNIDPAWSGAIPATLVIKDKQRLFHEGAFTYKRLTSFINPLL